MTKASPGSLKGLFMQPFPQVFFKSILLAAVGQEDVGKNGHEMVNLPALVCLFYGIPVFLPLHRNSALLQGKENNET